MKSINFKRCLKSSMIVLVAWLRITKSRCFMLKWHLYYINLLPNFYIKKSVFTITSSVPSNKVILFSFSFRGLKYINYTKSSSSLGIHSVWHKAMQSCTWDMTTRHILSVCVCVLCIHARSLQDKNMPWDITQ